MSTESNPSDGERDSPAPWYDVSVNDATTQDDSGEPMQITGELA